MIVKILSRGKSFKGLPLSDARSQKGETKDRVGWTHTLIWPTTMCLQPSMKCFGLPAMPNS